MPRFIAITTICAILLSSSFGIQINQGAWAGTIPGENGKIAFARTVEDSWEIYVMNADGTGQTRLTNNPANDGYPDWSPDGEKIAFSTDRDGCCEIFVMNADDGSGQTRLTAGEHPSWSPDGEKIAFARGDIYVMNADGTGETRLNPNPALDGYPDWSPDGEKIAFTRIVGDNYEIYVMNADGTGETRLTNNTGLIDDLHPSWSPDGEKIAFDSDRDGNAEIYVMNADGTGQTSLTRRATIDWYPDWSPDGEKIAFDSDRDGNAEIYVMNADGTGQTRLVPSGLTPDGFHPSWSPNVSSPPEEDTMPPVLTVPADITEEATSEQGAEVTYTVTAQDNVDGNATLEADGSTVTQDDVGGNITMSCDPPSGSVFPIGDTQVECSARDATGNEGTASFTVTVNPPPSPPPTPTPKQVIEELISTIENLDDNVPQSVKTSLIASLNEVINILNDNNPDNDESVCGTLDAFINQVNANETSDTLTADEADELSTQSEEIRNALDC